MLISIELEIPLSEILVNSFGINPDKFMLVFKSTSKVFKFLLLTPIISID